LTCLHLYWIKLMNVRQSLICQQIAAALYKNNLRHSEVNVSSLTHSITSLKLHRNMKNHKLRYFAGKVIYSHGMILVWFDSLYVHVSTI